VNENDFVMRSRGSQPCVEVVVGDTASLLCGQAAPCVFLLTTQGHQFFLVSFDDFGGARVVLLSLKFDRILPTFDYGVGVSVRF